MPIYRYFESIDDCIHYAYDRNHPYTDAKTINNSYKMVLSTGLYM